MISTLLNINVSDRWNLLRQLSYLILQLVIVSFKQILVASKRQDCYVPDTTSAPGAKYEVYLLLSGQTLPGRWVGESSGISTSGYTAFMKYDTVRSASDIQRAALYLESLPLHTTHTCLGLTWSWKNRLSFDVCYICIPKYLYEERLVLAAVSKIRHESPCHNLNVKSFKM